MEVDVAVGAAVVSGAAVVLGAAVVMGEAVVMGAAVVLAAGEVLAAGVVLGARVGVIIEFLSFEAIGVDVVSGLDVVVTSCAVSAGLSVDREGRLPMKTSGMFIMKLLGSP